VGLQLSPLSLVSIIEELLGRKISSFGRNPRIRPQGSVNTTTRHPLSLKVVSNLDDKRRSLGLYSSLPVLGHGV
jgi:hypothetical protein